MRVELFDGEELTHACSMKKGIYCWVNTINSKKYVGLAGGSRGLRGRIGDEINSFRKGSHKGTPLLWRAIEKYGLGNFRVYCLFEVDECEYLGDLEQNFIKMYNSITPGGYNITSGGSGMLNFTSKEGIGKRKGKKNPKNSIHRSKTYCLINPEGEPVHITNLASYCKAYNLSESAMRHLIGGRLREYKGWKIRDTKQKSAEGMASTAFFKNPTGEIIKVTNITRFAKFMGLQQAALNLVWLQRPNYNSTRGWVRASQEEIEGFMIGEENYWEHTGWAPVVVTGTITRAKGISFTATAETDRAFVS